MENEKESEMEKICPFDYCLRYGAYPEYPSECEDCSLKLAHNEFKRGYVQGYADAMADNGR